MESWDSISIASEGSDPAEAVVEDCTGGILRSPSYGVVDFSLNAEHSGGARGGRDG